MPNPSLDRRRVERTAVVIPVALLALALTAPAAAIDRSWVGAGGAWHVPDNWLPTGVPDGTDTARLTSGVATLAIDAVVGALLLDGGSLSGPGMLEVIGDADWGSGAQSGNGETRIGSALNLFGRFDKTLASGRSLFSADSVWQGNTGNNNGRMVIGTDARFTNTGIFREAQAFSAQIVGSGRFVNLGTFAKTSDTTTAIASVFDNGGRVDVKAGQLRLGGGGEHQGGFEIADGARLGLDGGTHRLLDGATIGGAGILEQAGAVLALDAGANIDDATPMVIAGGILRLAGSETLGPLVQSGGIVEGPGTLVVAGDADWLSGTHRGATDTRFDGALTLDGTGTKTVADGRQVFAGDTVWRGSTGNNGQMRILGGSRFTNTGVFREDHDFDNRIESVGRFVNQGLFEKTSDTTTVIEPAFDNTGRVDVRAGQLRLVGGGDYRGDIDIAGGARLAFDGGSHQVRDGAEIGGSGTLELGAATLDFEAGARISAQAPMEINGGLLRLAEAQTVASLIQRAGIVEGAGALIVTGSTEWRGGTHRGATETRFAGPLSLAGSNDKLIADGRQVLAGDTTWQGNTGNNGRIIIGTNAHFTNTGVFREAQDFDARMEGAGRFENPGHFEKRSNTTTTIVPTIDNTGSIEVLAGTLEIGADFDNAGVVSVADAARVAAGSAFANGGTLTGDGSFAIRAGRDIVNRGRIEPGTHGTGSLSFDGDLALATGSVLAFELSSVTDFDRILVDGDLAIGGELSILQLGYVPRLADTFVVASFATAVGLPDFEAVTWRGFGDGVAFIASINPDNITLTVSAVPEPSQVLMLLAGLALIAGAMQRRAQAEAAVR
ncbi:MAG: PEP-CTERM sorting domain-containing protein [Zoogloeaceae bacterium]|nr:PEP-CTERM sorting domain-containing protein [Rhodocyclaceae bacterium]MCP5236297.1 PEP-CTERM sorting domain-containing protein [Zoogloeaceae bacterium]